jgi:hypothetical protein
MNVGLVLTYLQPAAQWQLAGEPTNAAEYDAALSWYSDTVAPTWAEVTAAWPQADYASQCAVVEVARLTAYEQQSDPLYFKWQRGDATEAEWRAAVAKVKVDNPYPPAP